MKVQIWSDVMCPFCYIGKRRFGEALAAFPFKDEVEVEWKSFQLNPNIITDPSIRIDEYLANAKGWQLDYAKQVNGQVTEMAAQVGLTYDFDRAIVANSFNAHRFTHFAKKYNLGDAAEESLFKAYFTQGRNMDDIDTLVELGTEIELQANEVRDMLNSSDYTDAVREDIIEAESLGIRGVPFFVMNNQYAVSGAQPIEVFANTLLSAYTGWQQQGNQNELNDGTSCEVNGNC
jgi:predicted DsbA family dithiol-disulfide isomerase